MNTLSLKSHTWKGGIPKNRKIAPLKVNSTPLRFFGGLCPTLGAVGGESLPTGAADVVDESAETLIGTTARRRL